jgi:hypothetical protein
MAKVTMPLMSGTASGQLAKAVVHFGWKGIAVVRKYLIPANPKSADQGDVRLVLGGLGAATRAIDVTSLYADDARAVAPSGQTFVSALVGYDISQLMPDATEFEAIYTAYAAHGAKATFDSKAATLGLADFDIAYKGTTHAFVAGMQLYCLARYGILRRDVGNDIFNRSPYDTAIGSWTATEVGELETDLGAV